MITKIYEWFKERWKISLFTALTLTIIAISMLINIYINLLFYTLVDIRFQEIGIGLKLSNLQKQEIILRMEESSATLNACNESIKDNTEQIRAFSDVLKEKDKR